MDVPVLTISKQSIEISKVVRRFVYGQQLFSNLSSLRVTSITDVSWKTMFRLLALFGLMAYVSADVAVTTSL